MSEFWERYTPVAEEKAGEDVWFAGANTAHGFVGAYTQHIKEETLDRLYILKGGSGTGKSTLIRACADRAREAGADVTTLLCSSDPSSADGAIFQGKNGYRMAIVDGTAPHTLDPQYAGAVSTLVNVGDHWDTMALQFSREEIEAASRIKSAAYRRAYRYLGAYQQVGRMREELLRTCILQDKLQGAVNRLAVSIGGDRGHPEMVYTYALAMTGAHRLTTLTNDATVHYHLRDHHGSGIFFLRALKEALDTRHTAYRYSSFPADEDCLAEIRTKSTLVSHSRTDTDGDREINMHRFLDRRSLADCRARLRFARRCREMLLDGAQHALKEAADAHFTLEEIYKSAMDFDSLSQMREKIADEISEQLT